jgi:hypothetical protein
MRETIPGSLSDRTNSGMSGFCMLMIGGRNFAGSGTGARCGACYIGVKRTGIAEEAILFLGLEPIGELV